YNYQLDIIVEKLKNSTKQFRQIKINQLLRFSNLLEKTSAKVTSNQSEKIRIAGNLLKHKCALYTQKQNLIINNLENKAVLLDPENILKRGYSITYFNGEKLKYSKKIKENDEIITKLFSGLIRSRVSEKFEK
ncbi:MAG: hypothetical protein K8R31_13365, partial [Bacteroidales bacterium]|nr:hypothetical protein [Bacteroidales bacterium]